MKLSFSFVLVCFSTLMILGCDKLKKTDDALDAIPQMKDTTVEMKQTTVDMKDNMVSMRTTIHKQTLLVAINELAKRENYEKIYPVPTELLAPAKGFAEEAETKELIEFTYAMLKDIVDVAPMKEFGTNCNLDESVTSDIKELEVKETEKTLSFSEKQELRKLRKMPAKLVAKSCPENYNINKSEPYVEMDHSLQKMNEIRLRKLGSLYALMTIAGFTPEERVKDLIKTEISTSGRYETTAKQFLMMRVVFIRDVFLTNSLLSADLHNSGEIKQATVYMLSLEKILRLSFAEDISLKLTANVEGFKDPVLEVDETLAGAQLKKTAGMWKTILDRATNGVKTYKMSSTGDGQTDQQQLRLEQDRQAAAIQQVFTYGKAWFSDLQMP